LELIEISYQNSCPTPWKRKDSTSNIYMDKLKYFGKKLVSSAKII
jgi:hypothetical protein